MISLVYVIGLVQQVHTLHKMFDQHAATLGYRRSCFWEIHMSGHHLLW